MFHLRCLALIWTVNPSTIQLKVVKTERSPSFKNLKGKEDGLKERNTKEKLRREKGKKQKPRRPITD